jgi:DNA replication and repair protein RecF
VFGQQVHINKIYINKLRNHQISEFELNHSVNIFYGNNGAGKTTILEAVALGGFSKSFLPCADNSLIGKGHDSFDIRIDASNDLKLPYFVKVTYNKNARKNISSSFGDNLYPKDIIGEMPLVLLSPDFKSITTGAPQDRREFIDRILSQSYKLYYEDLLKHRKVLKQRNALLTNYIKTGEIDKIMLEVWTEALIGLSASIIYRRVQFIKDFSLIFRDTFSEISQKKEIGDIQYCPQDIDFNEDAFDIEYIVSELSAKADKVKESELRRGVTLFGSHRDDFKIFLNSSIAKEFASQGQHKSLLISLKFAEFNFLNDTKKETPVILLDDIFSELDNLRIKQVLDLVERHNAQTFITINNVDFLKQVIKSGNNSIFNIRDGEVFYDN